MWVLIAFLVLNGKATTIEVEGFSVTRCEAAAKLVMDQQELLGYETVGSWAICVAK
jgi:hypothetical protein